MPETVTTVPTGPVVGFSETEGTVTVNVSLAVLEPLVAATIF